ncbi:MAG: class I SAM-dependent methyltransferase [Kiritimatiellia bacterium]
MIEKAEKPFSVAKFSECGLVYVDPQPDTEDDLYGEEYYREWKDRQMHARTGLWKRRLRHVRAFQPSGRLLDVGCGIGTFLRTARESGYEVRGTEISPFACRYIREEHDIDVLEGGLPAIDLAGNRFDVITFWHSLEHMNDPMANLQTAFTLIKHRGLLVIAVPNVDNVVYRYIYPVVKGRRPHLFSINDRERHLYFFSENTLAAMVRKAGFEVIRVGVDLGQANLPKKQLDWLALVLHRLMGRVLGAGIRLFARKSGKEPGE